MEDYRPKSPSPSIHRSAPHAEATEPHFQHRYRGSVSHISPLGPTPTEPESAFLSSSPGQLHHQLPQTPPPLPRLPDYSFDNIGRPALTSSPFANHQPPPQLQPQPRPQPQPQPLAMKHEDSYADEEEDYQPEPKQRPLSRAKKVKTEASDANGVPNNAPGVAEGIEVKTKFPVARIKRIMQADEDVGKVAQVTPVAVSKALELFMISLVTKSASEARARGSKRVTSAHLKQAVQKEEQFDFLTEIVSKVPDAPPPRAKDEDSDEPMDGVGKKKRGAPRRKRKGSDEL